MPERKAPKCIWVLFARGKRPAVYINAPTRNLRPGEELALYDFAASWRRDDLHTPKPKPRGKR